MVFGLVWFRFLVPAGLVFGSGDLGLVSVLDFGFGSWFLKMTPPEPRPKIVAGKKLQNTPRKMTPPEPKK